MNALACASLFYSATLPGTRALLHPFRLLLIVWAIKHAGPPAINSV